MLHVVEKKIKAVIVWKIKHGIDLEQNVREWEYTREYTRECRASCRASMYSSRGCVINR